MVEARLKMKNGAPAVYVNGEEFPFSQEIGRASCRERV